MLLENSKIKFAKTRKVKDPSRSNEFDAGIDFFVPTFTDQFINDFKEKNPKYIKRHGGFSTNINNEDKRYFILSAGDSALIPSGLYVQMESHNRALIAANKSGVATKHQVTFGAQVIDSQYQGELHISIINVGVGDVAIHEDMKIIQFIETPIYCSEIHMYDINGKPEALKDFFTNISTRGDKGFGAHDHV